MKVVFMNRNSQLRSGWKIAITLATFLVAANVIGGLAGLGFLLVKMISGEGGFADSYEKIAQELLNNEQLVFITGVIQNVVLILTVILFWKVFDRKPLRDMGLTGIRRGGKDLITGLVFGAVSMTVVFVVLVTSGGVSLTESLLHPDFSPSLITGLLLFIFVGFGEEMFSRGYCMTVLGQTKNKWVMVLVSSVVFSFLHSLNPEVTMIGFANIFLVGILFAYLFIKSGNLWMPIGYHITWNYFQGDIYGLSVSGMQRKGIYQTQVISENLINGGKFGPEAGLITTLVILAGLVAVWLLYRNRVKSEFTV